MKIMDLLIKERVCDSIKVKQMLLDESSSLIVLEGLAKTCIEVLRNGGKIIFCGNGGSFADAQHLSAEFTSRFMFDRESLPSVVLGANSSAMSAIGNDYGFEHVFSRELSSIGSQKDLLLALSTSGGSANIIKVIDTARQKKMPVALFTGGHPGLEDNFRGVNVVKVPSTDTARIQECHIMLGHILCEIVESVMFNSETADLGE
jgi:D-sedoheptulose 7-phosphate isomerase